MPVQANEARSRLDHRQRHSGRPDQERYRANEVAVSHPPRHQLLLNQVHRLTLSMAQLVQTVAERQTASPPVGQRPLQGDETRKRAGATRWPEGSC